LILFKVQYIDAPFPYEQIYQLDIDLPKISVEIIVIIIWLKNLFYIKNSGCALQDTLFYDKNQYDMNP